MLGFRAVNYLVGLLLCALAFALVLPMFVEFFIYNTKNWRIFAISSLICGTFGSLITLANHSSRSLQIGVREAFTLTAVCWVIATIFACLPFYWSHQFTNFVDAWFEAVSAFTTTGATIMTGLDHSPKGILLWRAILQWLGGIGIIVMAMTILPALRIGGMQLFRSEFSDRSEKILPRASQIGMAIVSAYSIFTVVCFLCLYGAGMDVFDAICHAMTTVSTGGLSTHDQSIAYFKNTMIEIIVAVFMIIGGTTFILFIKMWKGNPRAFFADSQVRSYLLVILGATLVLTAWQLIHLKGDWLGSLRSSLFCSISIITSTGFTTVDYTKWGAFPLMIILLLTLVGGCTGSTTGGMKIFRIQILFKVANAHLKQLRRPHGVFVPLYQGQKIPETVSASVFTFITLYCLSCFLLACFLAMSGLDLVTSFSAALSAIGNTGPGITDLIGPLGTFQPLSYGQKLLLMGGMLLGRLELLTVMVIFMPSFWRG